jgi:hypothetical protein
MSSPESSLIAAFDDFHYFSRFDFKTIASFSGMLSSQPFFRSIHRQAWWSLHIPTVALLLPDDPCPVSDACPYRASCKNLVSLLPSALYRSYSSHCFILALNDSIDLSELLVVVVALLLSILSIRAANLTHSWQICSTTPGFFPSRSTSIISIDIVPFRLSTVNFFLIKLVIVNLSFSALNLEICIWLLAEDQSHHQSCRPALAFYPLSIYPASIILIRIPQSHNDHFFCSVFCVLSPIACDSYLILSHRHLSRLLP